MAIETKKLRNKTVTLTPDSHKRAQLAASLAGKSLMDFLGDAVEKAAEPILKKNGINSAKLEAA